MVAKKTKPFYHLEFIPYFFGITIKNHCQLHLINLFTIFFYLISLLFLFIGWCELWLDNKGLYRQIPHWLDASDCISYTCKQKTITRILILHVPTCIEFVILSHVDICSNSLRIQQPLVFDGNLTNWCSILILTLKWISLNDGRKPCLMWYVQYNVKYIIPLIYYFYCWPKIHSRSPDARHKCLSHEVFERMLQSKWLGLCWTKSLTQSWTFVNFFYILINCSLLCLVVDNICLILLVVNLQ